MKNVLRLLILAAAVASFTLPAFAQDTTSGQTTASSAQDEQAKTDLYNKWRENRNGNADQQKIAYEAGKEYLAKYGASDDVYVQAVKKWVPKYEDAVRRFELGQSFDKKDYAKTFEIGRIILSSQPDDIGVILLLARAGYSNIALGTNNKSLNPDAARMVRRAIELIESGKAPEKWEPFPNRDEALAFLQYTLGLVSVETSPTDASAAFIKAAQSNGTFKREPSTYIQLANIYEANELKKLVDEYNAAFPPDKPITDDLKPKYDQMLAQVGKVQDRVIDAYARAAALMNSDPKYTSDPKLAAVKKTVLSKLTTYYKQRHDNSDAGLTELVNNVLSKPLMLPGQEPVTPTAATDGTATPTNATGQPAGATSPAQPAATPTPTPKPAATPTPAAKPTPTPTAKPATTTTTPPANNTPKPKPPVAKAKPAAKPAKKRGGKSISGR